MKNIKLKLEYDGSAYHGFQIQPDVKTVQGVLSDSLKKISGEDIKVYGCSRTDAGVHAADYCASFYLSVPIPPEKIAMILNNVLPDDIRILSSEEADEDFHARFSCVSKTYEYTVNTDPEAGVFTAGYEWQIRRPLDCELMKDAASYIIGTHDFKSFMTSGPEMETTVRTVNNIDIVRDGKTVKIYINADGYLYNMVRIITGTLYNVGTGKTEPGYVKTIIEKKDRSYAGPTAPPQGLALFKVYYDSKEQDTNERI